MGRCKNLHVPRKTTGCMPYRRNADSRKLKRGFRKVGFTKGENTLPFVDPDGKTSNKAIIVDKRRRSSVEIQDTVSDMLSNNPTRILRGLQRIREVSNQAPKTMDDSIWSTIIPRVLELSDPECLVSFRSAAVAIFYEYINTFLPQKEEQLISYGALPVLRKVMERVVQDVKKPDEDCCVPDLSWIYNTLKIVRTLGSRDSACRNQMFTAGFHNLLLKICEADFLNNKPNAVTFMEEATLALLDLCLAEPVPSFDKVKGALEVCMMVIMNSDYLPYEIELVEPACGAIAVLGLGSETTDAVEIEDFPEFIPSVIELVNDGCWQNHLSTVTAALKAIRRISAESGTVRQQLLAAGILPALKIVLERPKPAEPEDEDGEHEDPTLHSRSLEETCRILANLVSGDSTKVQAVIESEIFPLLAKVMETGSVESKTAAARTVCHALNNATEEQAVYLATQKLLQPMSKIIAQSSQL